MKTFVSYSHRNDVHRELLSQHLAVLRSEGVIEEWFDRKMLAGAHIDSDIQSRIDSSDLFLLLVSSHYLASGYCTSEMNDALERIGSGARVIPVILESCDWKSTPLGDLKALPKDGMPVACWPNENDAFLDIVHELRRVLGAAEPSARRRVRSGAGAHRRGGDSGASILANRSAGTAVLRPVKRQGQKVTRTEGARSRFPSYRVKRDFDDIERSDYREDAFGEIQEYFEGAVRHIDKAEHVSGRFRRLSPTSFTCTIVNRARDRSSAHVTFHEDRRTEGLGDICYSFTESGSADTAQGIVYVETNGYELFLRPALGWGGSMGNWGTTDEKLDPKVAAERVWRELLEHAGITATE